LNRRQIPQVAGALLLCALVVPFVVYAVPGAVGAEASYVVLSGSMEPAISAGDVVFVAPVEAAALATGDVITFDEGGDVPITHRVVGVSETEAGPVFETKGDANEDPDPGVVRPEQVVGQVVFTIPYIGHVVTFAGTTYGFAALVVVPLGLLAVLEIREYVAGRGGDADGDAGDEAESDGERTTAEPSVADDPLGADPSDADPEGFALSEGALTLGFGAFGLFAVYAGYIASVVQTTWAFTAAAAAVGALLLLGAVRFDLLGAPAEAVSTDGGLDTARTVNGEFHVTGGQPLVGIDSRADLHAMAAERNRPVVRDGDVEYLFGDGAVFCAEGAETDPEGRHA
jgi:signal peptidase